jgi:muramidase (phage lysozyme)
LIFPDSERQQLLSAVWNKRNKKWHIITKSEQEYRDKIDIRNSKEVLSPIEFVNALESGRYSYLDSKV